MKQELIKAFQNDKFGNVRVVLIGEKQDPYFVGKDVAECLGYERADNAIRNHVDDEDKLMHQISARGQNRNMVCINESGLYSLILGSKLESAKEFKRWVTSEVLPSIRKHGAYMTDDTIKKALTEPDFLIRLATKLKEEKEARVKAEAKIESDKPKVLFADAVSVSSTTILIGDLAKLLKQNGIETGQKRLFEWLRKNGYLIKRKGADYNSPTQYAMELGLFEVKETVITHSDGHTTVNKTTKVTGKGQQYFINKFLQNKGADTYA